MDARWSNCCGSSPIHQRVIAMANFFRRFGASDQKLKETDRSLIVQGFQTNYMQVARAIAVASVGLMPHDRHVVMRMQELLDKASDDAEFDGFLRLGTSSVWTSSGVGCFPSSDRCSSAGMGSHRIGPP